MTVKKANLSKSRLLSARQCVKRLHLEVYRPELSRISPATESRFEDGRRVGELARDIYGRDGGVLVSLDSGMSHALRKTARLLAASPRRPVFEATVRHRGVLVRIDVLLPVENGWRIVEVKASSRVKEEHYFDCAVQAWAFKGAGHRLIGTALAHVDTAFVYQGDNDYRALLSERDISGEVLRLLPAVPDWILKARSAFSEQAPPVGVGSHCNKPYDCPFMSYCWPADTAYPVQQLPRANKATLGRLIARGIVDLRDVPADELTERQRRVQRVVKEGRAELLPAARQFATALPHPRYYLDFETIAPAIPVWSGTRPYEVLPVQWSCHFEAAPGQLEHADFLDLTGEPPMRRLAESLVRVLGNHGPVMTYSSYERRVIDGLVERFPDLAVPLIAVIKRLNDLAPVAQQNYYHPAMAGSWSLKAVLPTISTEISYSELEEIQEGTAASEGYLEATDPGTTEARKAALREQLLRYCEIDTAAMVQLVRFFAAGGEGL